MKLWKKIALLCSLVLALIVGASSALLLKQAKNNILNLTYANVQQKQQALVRSFRNMLLYYHEERDGPTATFSLMKYCFQQFADRESVLLYQGETLCSAASIDPEYYLTLDESNPPQRFTGEINGMQILIVGSAWRMPNSFSDSKTEMPLCEIYVVQEFF